MMKRGEQIATGAIWLYAALTATWLLLRLLLGDSVWWLALLNAFAPFFFVPLAILLPLARLIQKRAYWIVATIPTVIFLLLYGGQFLPRPNHFTEQEETFSMMSFNVWGWSQSQETARVIRDEGLPDVVLLQELGPQMAKTVLAEVGDVYPYRLLEPQEGYRGMGILSRHPLRKINAEELTTSSWWRIQIAEVTFDDQSFVLYHCHPEGTNLLYLLEANLPIPDEVQAGFDARERMMHALKADIEKRGQPAIVAGDFNTTDQSEAYRILTEDLQEVHRAVGWGFGHTFPAYAGSFRGIPILPRQMRLDMVCYTSELMALSSRVGTAHGESDHLPVIVEMGWRD